MKIVIVSPYFYPAVGGVENYVLNVARGLKKDYGHDIVIITSGAKNGTVKKQKIEDMTVYRLPYQFKLSNTPMSFKWRGQIKSILENEKPDLINAHMPVPFMADITERVSNQIPFVLSYHNDLVKASLVGNFLAEVYGRSFTRKTLRRSNSIITTSQYYANSSKYLKQYQKKIGIVSPGVDLKKFNLKVDREWLKNRYSNKKIILFVGSMDKTHSHKGVDVLIKSISSVKKKFPHIQLIAVGKGDAIDQYKELAKEVGIDKEIDFPGSIPDEGLAKYYAGADVLVLPSTTSAEGFGMVLAEAHACGTPVIGSDVGGIPFVLQKIATGVLVRPNNVGELAKAIESTLKSGKPQDYDQLDNFAANIAELAWEKQVEHTSHLFEKATKELNIIQIGAYYPPFLGGMEKVIQEISERLAHRDYKVTVVTSNLKSKPSKHNSSTKSLTINRLSSVEFAHVPIIWNLFPRLLCAPSRSIFHVHIAQPFIPEVALIAAKIKRASFIAHFHLDVPPTGKLGFIFSAYKKILFPLMLRRADRVIVFSRNQSHLLQEKYGVQSKHIVIIPNGVDSEFFYNKPRILHDKTRLLFIGRLSPQKNVQFLLNTLAGVPNQFATKIIGEGGQKKMLQKLAEKKDLKNIEFTGRLNGKDITKSYKWADIFVLPSAQEGMPLVLLEAMAMGLPIVATDVIGNQDVVKNGENGILATLDDTYSLQKALLQVANKQNYNKLSQASRRMAEQYSWDTVVDEFERLYKELNYV